MRASSWTIPATRGLVHGSSQICCITAGLLATLLQVPGCLLSLCPSLHPTGVQKSCYFGLFLRPLFSENKNTSATLRDKCPDTVLQIKLGAWSIQDTMNTPSLDLVAMHAPCHRANGDSHRGPCSLDKGVTSNQVTWWDVTGPWTISLTACNATLCILHVCFWLLCSSSQFYCDAGNTTLLRIITNHKLTPSMTWS